MVPGERHTVCATARGMTCSGHPGAGQPQKAGDGDERNYCRIRSKLAGPCGA